VEPREMAISRQRLSKLVTMTMNTHATIEELLDVAILPGLCNIKYSIFSERKVGDYFFPELLVFVYNCKRQGSSNSIILQP
jgi:hypothetical protein